MRNVLIVDDHEVVRDGVKNILSEQVSPISFGEASTAPEALRLASEQNWDLVILDLSLAGRNGLELLKQLRQIDSELPVLILSMHSEEQYARRAFKAGAAGYVTKDSSRRELMEAVNKVSAGGRYVSAALAERLIIDMQRDTTRPLHEGLSDREFEVMRLIASGKTVVQIGEFLSLSDKTISTYRARILEKMGMRTSAELMHYAIQNKLVDAL
jgi:two-component system, NarL family, invasion response regulator UvrY